MAIAKLDSVTVSIAAETIGVFNTIFLVIFVFKTTSLGNTFENEGTNNTSSKVKPSLTV